MSSSARFARWWAARSTRSERLSTPRAESAAASRPPNATSSTATATKTAIMRLAFPLGEREADEDVALDAEHLLLVVGLRVIEAEQVQHAVRGQEQQLVENRVTRLLGLSDGDLRTEHDVAEQTGRRDLIVAARAQLVHREAEDIGRAGLVHPLHVQLFHSGLVDQQDRQLG